MSMDTEALGRIFELSREAVLGIRDGAIQFINPAAGGLFGCSAGEKARDYLPEELLSDQSERGTVTFARKGHAISASFMREDDGLLLVFASAHTDSVINRDILERSLMELGSNLGIIYRALGPAISDSDEKSTAMLYRSYYLLRRLHRHLTLAESIASDGLPCQLRITDLTLLCGDLIDSINVMVQPLGCTVQFEASSENHSVMADESLLETMLLNLITNSLLHTEPGRLIRMRLKNVGDACSITLEDTGEGFSPEAMSRAMGGAVPVSMTDIRAGAGLGLFVSRGIAAAHGGSLILESREGKGVMIRVSIPRIDASGVGYLSEPREPRHIDGMEPLLTELSVFLDRSYFGNSMDD